MLAPSLALGRVAFMDENEPHGFFIETERGDDRSVYTQMARLLGSRGGKARMAGLSVEERSELGRKGNAAMRANWTAWRRRLGLEDDPAELVKRDLELQERARAMFGDNAGGTGRKIETE